MADIDSVPRHGSRALTILTVIAVFMVLDLAGFVLVPITAAIVLKFVLMRPVAWLRRARIPEPVGAAIVLLCVLTGVTFAAWYLSGPALQWVDRAPEVLARVDGYLAKMRAPMERVEQATSQAKSAISGNDKAGPRVALGEVGWGDTLRPVAQAAATMTLLYLLLASGDLLHRKVITVAPTLTGKKTSLQVVHQIEEAVSGYLGTLTLINAGLGTALGLTLFALGMPAASLWGLLAALLNFVPYLGPLTTASILTLVGAATFQDIRVVVAVPAVFWIITSIEGSILRPYLLGRRLSLNPVIAFCGLLVFGWMWGAPGLLLAVPLLAVLKIIADQVESMAALARILGR